jgi:hypothetical protein
MYGYGDRTRDADVAFFNTESLFVIDFMAFFHQTARVNNKVWLF